MRNMGANRGDRAGQYGEMDRSESQIPILPQHPSKAKIKEEHVYMYRQDSRIGRR